MFKEGYVKPKTDWNSSYRILLFTKRKIGDEIFKWNQTNEKFLILLGQFCNPAPMARAFLNGIEMKINKSWEL